MSSEPERKRIIVNTDHINESGEFVTSKKSSTRKNKKEHLSHQSSNSNNKLSTQKTVKTHTPKISLSLLNSIRKNYQKKQNLMNNIQETVVATSSEPEKKQSNKEFLSSLDFLKQVVQTANEPTATPPLPKTPLKTSPKTTPMSHHRIMTPQYGCLKHGVLPTFKTIKELSHVSNTFTSPSILTPNTSIPTMTVLNTQNIQNTSSIPVINTTNTSIPTMTVPNTPNTPSTPNTHSNTPNISSIPNMTVPNTFKTAKRHNTKTICRTFKVGRSSTNPVVSVLLSNQDTRNRIIQQKQDLNVIPLNQIRNELFKAGLIKIGSDAPENILRKMYENMILIGGPIKNFNPDIIAFNLLHHPELYAN